MENKFEHQQVFEVDVAGTKAWLVIDQLKNGLSFGGFRFDPTVSLQQVRNLAQTMSWKLASHGLPVGGAKAGIACDPSRADIQELLTQLARSWEQQLTTNVVLGKDMGATNSLLDGLYSGIGQSQLNIVQGSYPHCPNKIRDLAGYKRDMTGLGAVIAAETAVNSLKGKDILIQGAGVVAQGIAIRAAAKGARIVGISDVDNCLYSSDGVEVVQLIELSRTINAVIHLDEMISGKAEASDRDSLFEKPADILFLAAGSHTVDEHAAARIKAPVVIETSNFGLTDDANEILYRRGISVIPDIISSSSSAAMSSHQIASGNSVPASHLWATIENCIRNAVKTSVQNSQKNHCSIRSAYMDSFVSRSTADHNNDFEIEVLEENIHGY